MHTAVGKETIAVVIPCYRVSRQILDVVRSLPPWIDAIYCVDDACSEGSGRLVQSIHAEDRRVHVIFHPENQGVGGAVVSGFDAAVADGHSILVKMDGDGQMAPEYLPRLLHPITARLADFTKGNRFFDLEALRQMPMGRRLGNFGLTLVTKLVSGHWHVSDPTNGYIAIHRTAYEMLNSRRLARRYFFETSLLIQLNIVRAVAMEAPMPARYGAEESSLRILHALFGFPPRLAAGLAQRLLWRYFIYDINAVTILLVCGTLSVIGGGAFGFYRWYVGVTEAQIQSTGTVAIALLPVIIGLQMLLQALLLDVVDQPRFPLREKLCDRRD